jgi:hypothetical protein
MSFDWKKTLATVAPALATALGGPLAGLATQAVGAVFGLGTSPAEEDLAAALQGAKPEDLLALKKADQEFTLRMRELDIDLERIAAGDRKSAREREKNVSDRVPGMLAMFLTFGFFSLLGWLVTHEPPAGSRDILNIMLGSLGTGWITMLAYYYGSSSGADAQTRQWRHK